MRLETRPPTEAMIDVVGRLVSGERIARIGADWKALPSEEPVAGVVVAGVIRRRLARVGKPNERDVPELILNDEGRALIEGLWEGAPAEPQP